MLFEQTLARTVEFAGVGLHHGVPVKMKLKPAPAGTGIVFVRTDLDNYKLPASWQHVARVSYATSLMRQGVLISTTEHLLSVLYSIGVDNAWIEIDNLEVPILDGSGKPFVERILDAGIVEQKRPRRYIRVRKPVTHVHGDKKVTILPANTLNIDCEIYFPHPLVGRQTVSIELTPANYASEIAPARTFGFEQELDAMRNMGLIRGASLDNAVCFAPAGVLNNGGLRFADEPCRHKILDLIGDFALMGRPLLGRVIAERAGHAMHAALVHRIMQDPSLYETVTLELPAAVAV
ncbi:MAG: UDP-3-O-acyl-N-acetylglucosamine deacetylase [Acidobacteria bacterium]|nr:UDP-3-O-acyl-N-acetylglucosamine deacetylase [Acidobacteriota bacterium]